MEYEKLKKILEQNKFRERPIALIPKKATREFDRRFEFSTYELWRTRIFNTPTYGLVDNKDVYFLKVFEREDGFIAIINEYAHFYKLGQGLYRVWKIEPKEEPLKHLKEEIYYKIKENNIEIYGKGKIDEVVYLLIMVPKNEVLEYNTMKYILKGINNGEKPLLDTFIFYDVVTWRHGAEKHTLKELNVYDWKVLNEFFKEGEYVVTKTLRSDVYAHVEVKKYNYYTIGNVYAYNTLPPLEHEKVVVE